MTNRVFILSDGFYYDRGRQVLHGTDGEVEVQGRLANVLDYLADSPDHRLQVGFNSHFIEEPNLRLSKRTFRNYVTEINGIGKQIGLGTAHIIRHQVAPDSQSRWTLQVYDSIPEDGEGDLDRSIRISVNELEDDGKAAIANGLADSVEEVFEKGWLESAIPRSRWNLLASDLLRYFEAVADSTSSVISEYRSDMTIDVSGWPENPYQINQTVAQVIDGAGSDIFSEQCELHDELKASTFRYTNLVLRDEAGQVLLRRDWIPHWSESNDKPPTTAPDGWHESISSAVRTLDDPPTTEFRRLDYVLEKDGFAVQIRSWPHHSAAFSWDDQYNDRAPRRNRQGGFYTADVLVQSPPGRRISVELSFQYDAWFVSDSRFFTQLVFAPAISARIIGAEANESGYDFRLRQFSSQSPFWRRDDGKRYVKDVMLAGNNPHYLSWHYPDQWLMLGEGYLVTVDAFKPNNTRG